MTTTLADQWNETAANRPAELSEALGKDLLLRLTLDAVQCLDHSKLNVATTPAPQFRPQMMLTLLAYCYAAGIYGSRAIEGATFSDETVCYICARTFPDWIAIRQFRRHHRELVEQCLAHVLNRAFRLQHGQVDEVEAACRSLGPELTEEFVSAARERIEAALIMDTAETD